MITASFSAEPDGAHITFSSMGLSSRGLARHYIARAQAGVEGFGEAADKNPVQAVDLRQAACRLAGQRRHTIVFSTKNHGVPASISRRCATCGERYCRRWVVQQGFA